MKPAGRFRAPGQDASEVWSPKMESVPNPTNKNRSRLSGMWKTPPQPRIKPAIARDTTCSVSLLTGTSGGSNFAIPSNKFPPHGNEAELPSDTKLAVLRPARGDSAFSACQKGSGAWASRSVSPAPETLTHVQPSGFREAGSQIPCGGRSLILQRGATPERQHAIIGTCPPAKRKTSFSLARRQKRRSPQWKV